MLYPLQDAKCQYEYASLVFSASDFLPFFDDFDIRLKPFPLELEITNVFASVFPILKKTRLLLKKIIPAEIFI